MAANPRVSQGRGENRGGSWRDKSRRNGRCLEFKHTPRSSAETETHSAEPTDTHKHVPGTQNPGPGQEAAAPSQRGQDGTSQTGTTIVRPYYTTPATLLYPS